MPRARIREKLVQRNEARAEQRVTFIIRLTVDERGWPLRTEIEHAQSGQKESFPGLDVQRLVAFVKTSVDYAMMDVPKHNIENKP